jgi:hypothetical protein
MDAAIKNKLRVFDSLNLLFILILNFIFFSGLKKNSKPKKAKRCVKESECQKVVYICKFIKNNPKIQWNQYSESFFTL